MNDKNLWNKFLGSFDNESSGFSAKKCTAFILTVTYCYSHKFVSHDNLMSILIVDAGLITALFGINVVDKKTNGTNPPNNEL